MGPLTSIALEREPVESSTPSGRYDALSVEAGDLALRHGALQARTSQLCDEVQTLLANIAEIKFDAPKLLERVKAAMEKAKTAAASV